MINFIFKKWLSYSQMILTVSILLFVSRGIGFTQTETCMQNLNHPNLHTLDQVTADGTIMREYILYVSANYDPSLSSPLIINMHGFGDCASDYAQTIGEFYAFDELADQENCIVAYPQGAYRPEKEDTYWEPGDTGFEDIYQNDVYFIEQLIGQIREEYTIDENKIYACGYSNGGMMAYSLACNNTGLFKAIGIMSGTMLEEECSATVTTPIIVFHGIADEVLPYEGNLWYQSVGEVIDFWLDQNAISANSKLSSELNDGKVILDEYSNNDENTCLSLYTIYEEHDKPGDHVWFSDLIGDDSPNQVMYNFFDDNCSSVSTNTSETMPSLTHVYPNPFDDKLTIVTKNEAIGKYSIYNSLGLIVSNGEQMSNQLVVSLEELPAGIYSMYIETQLFRILKQ